MDHFIWKTCLLPAWSFILNKTIFFANIFHLLLTRSGCFLQCGGDQICAKFSHQLGRAHVPRQERHVGQGEDNVAQRRTRPNRVHFLGQNWHPHTKHHVIQQMLDRRKELRWHNRRPHWGNPRGLRGESDFVFVFISLYFLLTLDWCVRLDYTSCFKTSWYSCIIHKLLTVDNVNIYKTARTFGGAKKI